MALNLRGTARSGQPLSYKDPEYASIEAGVETKLGLPSGSLSLIRTKGERSNANQVSEAGARTVYQIIPATREGVLKKYGVDAYADAQDAAMAAGHVLKEGLDRNHGDLTAAVGEYHGGTDRSNWGPRTRAYQARITGQQDGFERPAPGDALGDQSTAAFVWGGNGLGADDFRRPLGPNLADKPSKMATKVADAAALGGIPNPTPVDGAQAGISDVQHVEADEVTQHAEDAQHGFGDRLWAGFAENSLSAELVRAVDREHPEADPLWVQHYMANRNKIESFAQNQDEVDTLRESTSQADLDIRKQQIEASRQRVRVLNSGGSTQALVANLAGGFLDPAGWVAGLGVGKTFEMAGIGARSLYLSGRTAAALGSLAAEGSLGNVAVTAGLDMAGEHMNTSDYASAAGFGLMIGMGLAPLHLRGVRNSEIEQQGRAFREQAAQAQADLYKRAAANVGDGDMNAVNLEMRRLDAEDKADIVRRSLSPVDDEHRLAPSGDAQEMNWDAEYDMPYLEGPAPEGTRRVIPEDFLTSDPDLHDAMVEKYGLDAIPDEGTRALSAEYYARAEKILADVPIDKKALRTVLKSVGMESTSNTLLSSDNPLANAWAASMLESPQGAAGRRASAAIEAHVREKVYLRELAQWENSYTMFRKGEGVGVMREAWTGDARREFNRRVYAEREARSQGLSGTETNRAVLDAADMLDRGYDLMRREGQFAGIVGHARLGDTSVGYQPHRISAEKAAALTKEQSRSIRTIISEQLQSEANAYEVRSEDGSISRKRWDADFADKFATKYLDDAARRAQGGWDIPVNIHDPAAADVVFDVAQAMNLSPEQSSQLLGKFSRGGANFTKGRLRLDMLADIPDGSGGTMKLMDLFNQDGISLYRAYARRMAGEVALAQRGVLGKKGIEVYRDAMRVSGADNATLHAFDQTAAELMNTPFGEANHKYMDNIRVMTSLSRLGGMGFTQMGEYGNALPMLGIARTLQAIGGFRRLAAEVGQLAHGNDTTNAILKDIDNWAGGVGVTEFHFSGLYNVPDNDIKLYNSESIGLGTRVVRAAGNLQAVLSGHRMILGAQVRGMAEAMTRKALEFARDGKNDAALRDAGISDAMSARLRENLDRIASFEGGKLSELRLNEGDLTPAEIGEFRQAIIRSANQIIQHTFTGETGKWAHNGILKMLTQFRTFGIISIEKQWGRNVANYGAIKSFAYLIGAMSFAAPITLARLHARTLGMSRSQREKYLKDNVTLGNLARATMNYASASGVAGDIWDLGTGVAGGWMGPDRAESVGFRGQGQGGVGNLVPAIGVLDDSWQAAHGNPHKLNGLLPFSNLPFVQPALNAIGSGRTR